MDEIDARLATLVLADDQIEAKIDTIARMIDERLPAPPEPAAEPENNDC